MKNADSLSRRHFLRTTGRAATALGVGRLLCGGPPACLASAASMPPVAVFSKVYLELKLDFQQAAELTAEAGLEGVDCPVRPKEAEITPEQAADRMPQYAEALAKHGRRMLLLSTGVQNVDSPHARDILATGHKLGIQHYRLGYWMHRPEVPAEKLCAEIRAQLKELAALNRELGIAALMHNHSSWSGKGRGPAGGDLNELYELVKDFDPAQIAVAFDLGHAIVVHGDDWRKHFERLKPHIRVVYVKDVRRPSQFVAFGQGEFSRTGFFAMLAQMNYTAPLSLHMEYPWAAAGKKDRPTLLAALKENRRVLGQWWKGTS